MLCTECLAWHSLALVCVLRHERGIVKGHSGSHLPPSPAPPLPSPLTAGLWAIVEDASSILHTCVIYVREHMGRDVPVWKHKRISAYLFMHLFTHAPTATLSCWTLQRVRHARRKAGARMQSRSLSQSRTHAQTRKHRAQVTLPTLDKSALCSALQLVC